MPSSSWTTTGNAGTNPPSDFLGTPDNEPLVIKTNGAERVRVDASGNVGIGTGNPTAKLYVNNLDNSVGSVLATNKEGPGELRVRSYMTQPTYVTSFSIVHAFYNDERNGSINFRRGGDTYGGWLSFGTNGTERLYIDSSGNVGIGPATPSQLLSVSGAESAVHGFGAAIGLTNLAPGGRNWYLRAGATGTATPAGGLSIADDSAYRLVIDSSGNVGIGTTSPTSALQVNGDVSVSGDVLLTGADCAEDFDVSGAQPLEPGTVVVIDKEGALRASHEAYDKKVAGVVSGAGDYRHGLVLDKRGAEEGRIPVALVGKVYCKVDAQYAPIDVGDLLTTSLTPGHAMKASDEAKAFGSVIGKALKPLQGGQDLIPILIALQ
jgi:hypothetical protein